MASFLDFIGDQAEAEKAFHKVAFNFEKARADRKARNARALEQYRQTDPIRGKSEIKLGNGHVRFAPKVNGNPFAIGGHDSVYIAAERFPDFIAALDKAIDAGELDAAMEAASNGVEAKPRKPRAAKEEPSAEEAPPEPVKRGRPRKVAEPA